MDQGTQKARMQKPIAKHVPGLAEPGVNAGNIAPKVWGLPYKCCLVVIFAHLKSRTSAINFLKNNQAQKESAPKPRHVPLCLSMLPM